MMEGAKIVWRFDAADAGLAQAARHDFARRLRASGATAEAVGRAELVFGELVSNVVRHAPGPVRVSAVIDPQGCTLEVRDFGRGFRSRQPHPASDEAESGRGLHLVRGFAQRVRLENQPDGGARVLAELPIR